MKTLARETSKERKKCDGRRRMQDIFFGRLKILMGNLSYILNLLLFLIKEDSFLFDKSQALLLCK